MLNHLLSLPILASILILGVFAVGLSFDNAEAKKSEGFTPQVGDEYILKGKGAGTCTFGEDSGTAKAGVRFLFLITEADETGYRGIAKSEIKIKSTCEGAPTGLVNDGALGMFLEGDERILIEGPLKARDGTSFSINAIGVVNEGKKTTIDLVLNIGGQEGEEFNVTVDDMNMLWMPPNPDQ